jgi:hypothetical protein
MAASDAALALLAADSGYEMTRVWVNDKFERRSHLATNDERYVPRDLLVTEYFLSISRDDHSSEADVARTHVSFTKSDHASIDGGIDDVFESLQNRFQASRKNLL